MRAGVWRRPKKKTTGALGDPLTLNTASADGGNHPLADRAPCLSERGAADSLSERVGPVIIARRHNQCGFGLVMITSAPTASDTSNHFRSAVNTAAFSSTASPRQARSPSDRPDVLVASRSCADMRACI